MRRRERDNNNNNNDDDFEEEDRPPSFERGRQRNLLFLTLSPPRIDIVDEADRDSFQIERVVHQLMSSLASEICRDEERERERRPATCLCTSGLKTGKYLRKRENEIDTIEHDYVCKSHRDVELGERERSSREDSHAKGDVLLRFRERTVVVL